MTTNTSADPGAFYGFADESLHGPRMACGSFTPGAAAAAAEHEQDDALRHRQGLKDRAYAYNAAAKSKRKLPPDAPRKRAPKKPRIPAVIAPSDLRAVLKAQGFTTAVGVRYHMAWLHLLQPGACVTIPASTNGPAHSLVTAVRSPGNAKGKRLHLELCPVTFGLRVRWLHDDEQQPPRPASLFGLDQLAGCGEFADVPVSRFPIRMARSLRKRVLYLDHVLSRASSQLHVDVLDEDSDTYGRLCVVLKPRGFDLTKPVPETALDAITAATPAAVAQDQAALLAKPLRNITPTWSGYHENTRHESKPSLQLLQPRGIRCLG